MHRLKLPICINGVHYSPEEICRQNTALLSTTDAFGAELIGFLQEWYNDDTHIRVKTSGSTGTPKEMRVGKQQMANSATMTCKFFHLTPGSSALLCMPLEYIAGKMMVVRCLVGGLNLLYNTPSGHPLALCKQIPHFAAMIPMQVYNTLQVATEREVFAQIQHVLIGGGSIDSQLAEQLQGLDNKVWSSYGMTETLSHIALRRINGTEATTWYTPLPGVKVEKGENDTLTIFAPHVNNEVLHTNDVVQFNDQGQFRIMGRVDNIINTGGIKVQIEQLEQQLASVLTLPFQITSVPHPKFGEAITLLVEQPEATHNTATINNLQEICRKHLPAYWCPKYFFTVDKLPLTETGKPNRFKAKILAKGLL